MTIKVGMGGLEIIKKLTDINPDVYVVISTGYSENDVIKNFKKYGFKDVLIKPFNFEKLRKIIENFKRYKH